MDTIKLDEIAPGATIRFTVIDGVQYLSIRDFIKHMCDMHGNHAAEIWRRLNEDKRNELNSCCVLFKFPGRGQQDQTVITFPGAIKLAMFLPGEIAKKNRSVMSQILVQYFAGDRSLLQEIEANAQSEAPIAQMARAALPAAAADQEAVGRKRVLEKLEVEERVVDMEYRRVDNEYKRAQTNQIQWGVLHSVMDRYIELCDPGIIMDERAKVLFKDSLLNFAVKSSAPAGSLSQEQACIADGA
jgi:hypothetical protein